MLAFYTRITVTNQQLPKFPKMLPWHRWSNLRPQHAKQWLYFCASAVKVNILNKVSVMSWSRSTLKTAKGYSINDNIKHISVCAYSNRGTSSISYKRYCSFVLFVYCVGVMGDDTRGHCGLPSGHWCNYWVLSGWEAAALQ